MSISSPSASESSVIGMLTVWDSEDPAGKVTVSLLKLPISVLSEPVKTRSTTVAFSLLGSLMLTIIENEPPSSSTVPSDESKYTDVGEASAE